MLWSVSQSQMDWFKWNVVCWCITRVDNFLLIKCSPKRSGSQVKGHIKVWNHILACISVINGTVWMEFGIMVYNHECISFCSLSVQVKGKGHRLRSLSKVCKIMFGLYLRVKWSSLSEFWYGPCVTKSGQFLFTNCLCQVDRSKVTAKCWNSSFCL